MALIQEPVGHAAAGNLFSASLGAIPGLAGGTPDSAGDLSSRRGPRGNNTAASDASVRGPAVREDLIAALRRDAEIQRAGGLDALATPAFARTGAGDKGLAAPTLNAPAANLGRGADSAEIGSHANLLRLLESYDGKIGQEDEAARKRLTDHQQMLRAVTERGEEAEASIDEVRAALRQFNMSSSGKAQGDEAAVNDFVARLAAHRQALQSIVARGVSAASRYRDAVAQAIASEVKPDRPTIEAAQKHSTDVFLLFAQLSTLLRDSAVADEQAHQKTVKSIQSVDSARARRKVDDYLKEMEKARQAERTFGALSKILGIGLAILGFVGALFTGGATLAVAAAGLALTVADSIHEAVTGRSFIGDALAPVMRQVTQWVQKAATAMAEWLEEKGMAPGAAQALANFTVYAVAIAAIALAAVGVTMAAGSQAAARMFSAIGRPLLRGLQTAVGKIGLRPLLRQFGQALRPLGSALGKLRAKFTPVNASEMAAFRNRLMRLQTGARFLEIGTTSGMDIASGVMRLQVGKSEAEKIRAVYAMNEQSHFIRQTGDEAGRRASLAESLASRISEMVANDAAAKQAITQNLARI